MSPIFVLSALMANGLPPSACAAGVLGFDFEAGTQGAWAESFAAKAFDKLEVDSTRALCGRSSIRVRASFSPTGVQMPTLHPLLHFPAKR
jgi:hypothetical protein